MNIKELSDEDLRNEQARRSAINRKVQRAAAILRDKATDEKLWPGKKMTIYQANAAVQVICEALQMEPEKFADAIIDNVKS